MIMTPGQSALYDFIVANGSGDISDLMAFVKAPSGDMKFKVAPADSDTLNVPAGSNGFTKKAVVSLVTADGELHRWYNGPVTLAIADTSAAGAASISPAAGSHNMVDGQLVVTITGSVAAWLASETATLTVSAVEASLPGVYDIAAATGVVNIV